MCTESIKCGYLTVLMFSTLFCLSHSDWNGLASEQAGWQTEWFDFFSALKSVQFLLFVGPAIPSICTCMRYCPTWICCDCWLLLPPPPLLLWLFFFLSFVLQNNFRFGFLSLGTEFKYLAVVPFVFGVFIVTSFCYISKSLTSNVARMTYTMDWTRIYSMYVL